MKWYAYHNSEYIEQDKRDNYTRIQIQKANYILEGEKGFLREFSHQRPEEQIRRRQIQPRKDKEMISTSFQTYQTAVYINDILLQRTYHNTK